MGKGQILRGGPGEGYVPVVSAGKEKNSFSKVDGKLIFNFKSISILKGPDFSDSGTDGEAWGLGRGICYFII